MSIIALDEAGDELDRLTFMFDPPGPGRTVDFDVTCDQVGEEVTCTGTQTVGGGGGGGTDGGSSSGGGGGSSSSGGADGSSSGGADTSSSG